MCGIAGFWQTSSRYFYATGRMTEVIEKMADSLVSRGPDDTGIWIDAGRGIALGHRRLSIIDTSRAGHQPMTSPDGRYVITYNGEIYNFPELKKALLAEGAPAFHGHSDTEVLLAACSRWGVYKTVQKAVGMFAFALWDKKGQQLWLVRDRVGKKPLYYAQRPYGILFASQSKSFRHYPEWRGTINPTALTAFMQLGYIPHHLSIYKGVQQVPPATILKFDKSGTCTQEVYWTLGLQGGDGPQAVSLAEAEAHLEKLLREAVKGRLSADVPIGAFLSGGLDSSLVVALMQQESARPVKTFTIGFDADSTHDEARFAKPIAQHLGTEHTELFVTAKDALDVVPSLPEIYDEPFADSSQIPTYLISKLTRQYVTVALSGDGGDEIFAGYNRYLLASKLEQLFQTIPFIARFSLAKTIHMLPPGVLDRLLAIFSLGKKHALSGDRLHKLASIIQARHSCDIYPSLISQWPGSKLPLLPAHMAGWDAHQWLKEDINTVEQMQYADIRTYLPDDILTKVDRASMANSLEVRAPLLDHRVIEYAFSLPLEYKLSEGSTKWVLRNILYRSVPKTLIERPKMGFAVPLADWLRGPLRDWAEALLDRKELQKQSFLDAGFVHNKWQEHLSGRRNWHYGLWNVLMFQSWYSRYAGRS